GRHQTESNVIKKGPSTDVPLSSIRLRAILTSETEVTQMAKRSHGTGAIINRKGTDKLYIRYWVNGKQKQEPVGTSVLADAEDLLRKRLVDTSRGAIPPADIRKLCYEDIRESYLKLKPEQVNYFGLQYVDSFFKDMRVDRITPDVIENFIEHRRDEDEVSDPTIRRNLVCLRAMF